MFRVSCPPVTTETTTSGSVTGPSESSSQHSSKVSWEFGIRRIAQNAEMSAQPRASRSVGFLRCHRVCDCLAAGLPCLQNVTTRDHTKDKEGDLSKLSKDGEHGKPRAPSDAQSNIFVLRKMVEEVFTVLYSKGHHRPPVALTHLSRETRVTALPHSVQVRRWGKAAWSLCLMTGSRRTPAVWWPTGCPKESA